jgi:hypothetical protein
MISMEQTQSLTSWVIYFRIFFCFIRIARLIYIGGYIIKSNWIFIIWLQRNIFHEKKNEEEKNLLAMVESKETKINFVYNITHFTKFDL